MLRIKTDKDMYVFEKSKHALFSFYTGHVFEYMKI